jgi:hypothetical protein
MHPFNKYIQILVAILLLSCGEENAVDYVIFSETIEHPITSPIKIMGDGFNYEITVKSDHTFLDTIPLKSGYYSLVHGEYATLYLEPGYQLDLRLDVAQFDESLKFTGMGAPPNNYIAKKLLKKEQLIPNYKELFLLEEMAFVTKGKQINGALIELMDSLKPSYMNFYNLELQNLDYDYLTLLNNYESSHAYYSENEEFKATKSLLTPLQNLDYDNSLDYQRFSSYQNLVASKFINYAVIMNHPDTIPFVMNNILQLKSENIRNGLMQSLGYYLSPAFDAIDLLYEGIMSISTNEKDKKEFTLKYNKVTQLAKGALLPNSIIRIMLVVPQVWRI